MERIALEQLLRIFARGGFMNNEGAKIVGERPRRCKLAILLQAGQILPMQWTDRSNLRFVLDVFDDGGEFHDGPQARLGSKAGRVAEAGCVNRPCRPNKAPVKIQ